MQNFPDSERALRAAFPLLAATAGAELPRLATEITRHELEPGAVILRENEVHDTLFLVCQGAVAVACEHAGSRVGIGTLGASKWFGELGFLEAGPSSADVTATAPSLVLSLSRNQLVGYIEAHPRLADAILGEILPGMSQRLRSTRELIDHGVEPLTDTDRPPEWRLLRALRAFFGGAA